MVDDVKEITENAENKASAEALARARLVRERRETEQRKRLDELRAHAAAAQAQREKRDEERRKRQAEQRARDDDRRQQVEERKRAIWEASVSRREALLQRERDRTERLERSRASHSSPRSCFAFGSSTPRLLEPLDSAGFFWAARRAASTTNVMFASAPLTRRTSALQLDSEIDNKEEPDRSQQPAMWSSVARRRTDLVPTLPTSRSPGRAHSMTRLDKLPSQRPLHSASPSMHHLNRAPTRSGDTTPGSRPGSAMTNTTTTSVVRRVSSAPRKPRPASIAGTGVNTPRGLTLNLVDGKPPLHRKPKPSKDHHKNAAMGTDKDKMQVSAIEVTHKLEALKIQNGEEQPVPHNQNIDDKENEDKLNVAPTIEPKTEQKVTDFNKLEGRTTELQKSIEVQQPIDVQKSAGKKERSTEGQHLIDVQKPPIKKEKPSLVQLPIDVQKISRKKEKSIEVPQPIDAQKSAEKKEKSSEIQQPTDAQKSAEKKEKSSDIQQQIDVQKSTEKKEKAIEIPQQIDVLKPAEKKEDKKQEKKENSQDKTDEFDMTASMISRRITSEEEAKAALAERRRRAREELERHAELERQRLQREAEEELERQRLEEERQRREEEEAKELAKLQRAMEEEKLRKAIEVQQQLERDEAERKAREEVERQARVKEDEEKRKAAEETERLRKEEAEREERERIVRKQRVEAIMARTRLRKAEEDKQQENKGQPNQTQQTVSTPASATPVAQIESSKLESGNVVATGDLLDFSPSQVEETKGPQETIAPQTNNTVSTTAGDLLLLGLSEKNKIEQPQGQVTATINNQHVTDNSPNANKVPTLESNNGNIQLVMEPTTNTGHISANFIQTEILSAELSQTKLPENVLKQTEDDLTAHNGNGTHNHPLTLQNAI